MPIRDPQKSRTQEHLWGRLTTLCTLVQESIVDSWPVRISLATAAVLLFLLIWTRLVDVASTRGFEPHGECLLWIPSLITLFVGSDSSIGLAYVCISVTLIYFVHRTRHTIPFQWIFLSFGTFIIACGTTHFLDVLMLWVPAYWLLGTVKLLTALASVTTALALPLQLPRVLALVQQAAVSEDRKRQLEQAHRELSVLYEKSQDLDRLKTTFFANISHDLRTPLTLVLGSTQLLLEVDSLTDSQRQKLQVVQRNAVTLNKQVDDLLALARLEIGQMPLNTTRVDLAQLLRGCASLFEALAQERHLTLTVSTPPSVQGSLDGKKFQHICLNLLSNAFKFTPKGGMVRCELSEVGEWGIITVEDSGPGISPEARQTIFERFRQGGDTSRPSGKGAGLGLAIVKELVELQRGTIAVSDAPTGGALFTVSLPLMVSSSPQQETLEQEPALAEGLVSPFLTELSHVRGTEENVEQASQTASVEGEPPLVLVIEDHLDMVNFLVDLLTPSYRVAVARDGMSAYEKARTLQPDLLLCDLMMPRMSGEQLITKVRADRHLDTVPIMILSARADDALRIRLLREGTQEYLVKPFFPEELQARIANLIAMKQARQVLQQEVETQNQSLVILAREVALRKRESQQTLSALQRVNEDLTHANEVQRNFVAVVSHEFRTALTGIQGFSELMSEETLSEHEMKEYAADILTEARRLERMITGLLDLERMKSGHMPLTYEQVDLNVLIRNVLERLRPTTLKHLFHLQQESTLPLYVGDGDKLAQVVANLLSNAIKYSPQGGEIVVGTQLEGERVRVWVQDHGIGIPSESLEEVFAPYSRIDAGATRYIKGTGLGLSISRQIIQMHGGRIWVESHLGQGSCFHFTLPL